MAVIVNTVNYRYSGVIGGGEKGVIRISETKGSPERQ
jgi:hypothetical protein